MITLAHASLLTLRKKDIFHKKLTMFQFLGDIISQSPKSQPCSLPRLDLSTCQLGCDDLQFFCKKSFGPLIFECRLPKETSLSIWGTFTMFPIPPSSTTLVTEFFEERGKMDFPHFLVFYLARWFHMLLNPHQLPKQTIWYAWNYFGVPPYMCTGVTLVTENPFTGRKAQKCPNVLKEH